MASPLIGSSSGTGSSSATTYTAVPNGVNSFANWQVTLSFQPITVPVATTLSNLYFKVTTAPGGSAFWTITVMKNGVATALSVVVSGSATSNTDTVNTATFAAGDTMTIRSVPSGTPTAGGATYWNISSSATGQILSAQSNTGTSSAGFMSPMGFGNMSAETRAGMIMPCDGTFSGLYLNVDTAPGGAATKTTTLRVNGASSTLTATVSGASTASNDISNSVAVTAGDRVNFSNTVAGSPASSVSRASMIFTPTTAGNVIFGGGTDDDASTSATEYQTPSTGAGVWATETTRQVVLGDWTIKNFYGRLNVAAGAGRSWTLTVRSNVADTALAITLGNVITVVSSTIDVPVTQGDLISVSSVPSGTPTGAGRVNMGMLLRAPSTLALTETLTDTFTGGTIDAVKWNNFGTSIGQASNQLQYTTLLAGEYGGITSVVNYNLTGSYSYTQLVDAGNQSLASLEVYPVLLQIDSNNNVNWLVSGNTIFAYKRVAGTSTSLFSTAYVAATHAWFRIRESAGTTYWDTSVDGNAWTNRFSVANPIVVTNLTQVVEAGTFSVELSTTTVKFDNFNTTPAVSGITFITSKLPWRP